MKRKNLELSVILILVVIQIPVTQFDSTIETEGITTQNNLPLILQTDFDPLDAEIFIDSDTVLESFGFPGNGTENNPYRIENYIIDTYKLFGILVVNTTKHVIVRNNSVSASYTALKAEFNAPGTISFHSNTVHNSTIGMCVKYTADIHVQNNTYFDNNYGMTFSSVQFLEIEKNAVFDNEKGINMENNNSYSFVRYNNLWGNEEALLVINTRDVLIENNTIRNNDLGIILKTMNANIPTVNCSVVFNLLENNSGYGVTIPAFYEHRWTQENSLHHNTFANNNPDGKKQALDDGVNNEWDDEINTGNYWSDWWGLGSYNIRGLAKSKDSYPLNDPIHEVTTKIPGIFKGRIIIFVVFAPILLGGYIFVQTRKRRTKIKENEEKRE